MWGQVFIDRTTTWHARIIPTRVGTRHYPANLSKTAGDHPHACGDKSFSTQRAHVSPGSSPRVWGQDTIDIGTKKQLGIIPTRVGTSCCKQVKHGRNQDHPHACGDKAVTQLYRSKDRGSSPRVWGQAMPILICSLFKRIIPTRVGTSCRKSDINKLSKDHPHACGDKYRKWLIFPLTRGSSPRVWGQVIFGRQLQGNHRIIPTRVGTRLDLMPRYINAKDHPHACGDKCRIANWKASS